MIDALIDGWMREWSMARVVRQFGINADIGAESRHVPMALIAPKAEFVPLQVPCRAWIATQWPAVNERLWSGAKREAVSADIQRCMTGRRKSRGLIVGVRARDKGTDWKTVK